jgi:hypothetical protein
VLYPLSLERVHLWETKIKTLKGLRERDNANATQIKEQIGMKLFQELTRLSKQVHCSNQIITTLCRDILKN